MKTSESNPLSAGSARYKEVVPTVFTRQQANALRDYLDGLIEAWPEGKKTPEQHAVIGAFVCLDLAIAKMMR